MNLKVRFHRRTKSSKDEGVIIETPHSNIREAKKFARQVMKSNPVYTPKWRIDTEYLKDQIN